MCFKKHQSNNLLHILTKLSGRTAGEIQQFAMRGRRRMTPA